MPTTVRGERKRADIVRAALAAFLAGGYLGTSVDEIAAAAHTSKRTVYAHFADKEGLFRAAVGGTIAPLQAALVERLELVVPDDPRAAVRDLTRSLAAIVVTPQTVRLRRVVIAEADRFPDLAAEWYSLGPEQTVERLAAYLAAIAPATGLRLDDPRTAAEQLLWLSVSAPLNRLMFEHSGAEPEPGELERAADAAADTFWRAFGPPGA